MQFGEFTDHVGGQIGLGETRRLTGYRCIGTYKRRDIFRQFDDTRHTLRHGPEFGVESDAFQFLQPLIEIAFAVVFLPEEGAI